MNVNTLLVLSSATVGWADREADGEQAKALTIKKENLPYVDGSFRVGCMDQSANETKCTVDVKVAARASATEGQKAICAYGRESNAKKQEVTLSSARNSFTLVCGDKGEIVQASYKVAHCPVGKGEEALENCKEDYKTILPDYQEGWWTEENNKSITMKIPEDKFPEQDGSFMVPCQKAKNSDDKERPNALQDGSVCTVDVRILGVGKPSSSFPSPAVATGVSVFVIGAELLALAAPAGANCNSGATHSDAGHCAVIL
ncbi:SAG-related sequence [Besnoitia besnoiti]|uniref:SAG-related sequence n=1 Tax=Besnoitia besnoiti TaxID=94643 RepID=A0A2A9MLC3_BESBE|nr:SAG-related sequence [Besnoitia besnoiti]PFH36816.1 SAG-related sequence [Besnoitia besnoiti]